jgi:hypothetical protein
LNPTVKRGPFTPEEDAQILAAHAIHGNKWAVISRSMPGRTDNQVKNRFNSTLRRTLAQNGKAPPASSPPKKASSPVAAAQNLSSPMGSRKQSSNQLAKQANLKRVASQVLETMSCDESMESSQDNKDKMNNINNNNNNMKNNTGKETTNKNAIKRPKKSPTKTKLGKSVRGPSRGPSQDREDSGGSESVGLETLIQASLMELQRIKSGKSASGFDKEYYTMNNDQSSAHGGFGSSHNNNNINNNNINNNINNNSNNPTHNNATMSNMSDRTMNDSRGMVSSLSMENLNRARAGLSMPGIPSDSYDWRANSPVIGLPAFHSLNNQLVRRPSMLNIASHKSGGGGGGGGEQHPNANELNDPRAGTSALSTPVTITPNLASSWYGRMLENLGWRNHFPLDVLPMQEQEDIQQKDAKEAHEKFQPIENGEDEEGAPKEAAAAATTKDAAATDAAVNVKTETDHDKKEDELPSPVSDNTVKNDINGTTGTTVEAAAC